MDFDSVKAWYNGYLIDGVHMYNPNSVVQAMLDHDFDFYWNFENIYLKYKSQKALMFSGLLYTFILTS